jgi:hypothetical protein
MHIFRVGSWYMFISVEHKPQVFSDNLVAAVFKLRLP